MREPISACLSPEVCGKLISRFLEVNDMRAKITHSLEDELKVAELIGLNNETGRKHVSPIWAQTLSVTGWPAQVKLFAKQGARDHTVDPQTQLISLLVTGYDSASV